MGKSNHKHIYEECLLKLNMSSGHESYCLGKYCTICNKIKITNLFVSEKVLDAPLWRMLSNDEILERYEHLKIFDYKF